MYGDVVLKIPNEEFERCITAVKKEQGVEQDVQLTADNLEALTQRFKVRRGVVESVNKAHSLSEKTHTAF